MKIFSIRSSSTGNCIYIESGDVKLLFDVGVSKKEIEKSLKNISVDIKDINTIFISHEHTDHIKGLRVLNKNYDIPIYATIGTINGIKKINKNNDIRYEFFSIIEKLKELKIGNIKVKPFSIYHDANDPVGFIVKDTKNTIGIITDTGMYDDNIINLLKDVDCLILESNYDIRMLEVGPYPYSLKQRIISFKGHLSNEDAGELINKLLLINPKLKLIILGHLSNNNNFKELAYETVKLQISLKNIDRLKFIKIVVLNRNKNTDIINI